MNKLAIQILQQILDEDFNSTKDISIQLNDPAIKEIKERIQKRLLKLKT